VSEPPFQLPFQHIRRTAITPVDAPQGALPVTSETADYQVRRGWTASTVRAVAIVSPLLAAATVAVIALHAWLLIPVLLFFGVTLIALSYGAATHAPALRLDAHGITLTKGALPGRTRPPLTVPWTQMQAIIVTKAPRQRRIDALYLLTHADQMPDNTTRHGFLPDVPVSQYSPLTNWTLDIAQLSETARIHAPSLVVLDRR
jgi:hypothetical protein